MKQSHYQWNNYANGSTNQLVNVHAMSTQAPDGSRRAARILEAFALNFGQRRLQHYVHSNTNAGRH